MKPAEPNLDGRPHDAGAFFIKKFKNVSKILREMLDFCNGSGIILAIFERER